MIITYINVYPWNYTLIPKWSLILINLIYRHWYETKIKGHHPGASKLLESLQKAGLTVKFLLHSTRCHNYLFFPSNTTPFVTYKVGNNNLQDNPPLTSSVTISTYNISSPFEISKLSVQWPSQKKLLHPGGVRGGILNYWRGKFNIL